MLTKTSSFKPDTSLIIKFIFLIFIFPLTFCRPDDNKYQQAMEENLRMIDTASSLQSFLNIANRFERIAVSEGDKWLPYYYAAYNLGISSFIDTVKEKKDSYLDRADYFIAIADSLQPDNSEIFTLKALLAQGRIVVDPQNRWQKYGAVTENSIRIAKELDPENPRPDFLNGQTILYTPEQFGGGKEKALPILKEAERKYKSFEPESSIHPDWGEKLLLQMLEQISE